MFGIHNYAGFLTAIMLYQLAPGPGTLAILHATARGGRRGGMGAVLGTLAGDLVYMLAAVSGVAALLAATPSVFSLLQWGGIVYLCRLGCKLLFTTVRNAPSPDTVGIGHSFRQAFGVGLTNPKAIMFFMAFFPLFMTAQTKPATMIVMMVHISVICLVYQAGLVLAGHGLAQRFSTIPHLRQVASRLCGIALLAFGVKLAINK